MSTFIAILHVLVALLLIGLVLIQDSKGDGALGMGGGGGSNSVFGATGASTLAAKMTRIIAVVFALTSIGLSIVSSQESKSVLERGGSVMGGASATPTPPITQVPLSTPPTAKDAAAAKDAAPIGTPATTNTPAQ